MTATSASPGRELGDRDVVEVQALARVLVAAGEALEHVDLVLVDGDALVGVGEGDRGEVLGGGVAGEDGVEDVLHVASFARGLRDVTGG